MSALSRLTAVVLNYRTPVETSLAVNSLLDGDRPPDEVIVVDNEGSEECLRALGSIRNRVTYLSTERNLGFSGGINLGIRAALAAAADAVLLVNADVVVAPTCVSSLERALRATPDAGIAGPIVLRQLQPDRIESMGITYRTATGRMRRQADGEEIRRASLGQTRRVDAVSGCLMLITRLAFETIGLFDERYFFGFEDLDLCLRAKRAGLLTMLEPTALAYHGGSRSIGSESPRHFYFAARNHLLFASTVGSERRLASVRVTCWIIVLNVVHAAGARSGSIAARLAAVLRGTSDYFSGRFGSDEHVFTAPAVQRETSAAAQSGEAS